MNDYFLTCLDLLRKAIRTNVDRSYLVMGDKIIALDGVEQIVPIPVEAFLMALDDRVSGRTGIVFPYLGPVLREIGIGSMTVYITAGEYVSEEDRMAACRELSEKMTPVEYHVIFSLQKTQDSESQGPDVTDLCASVAEYATLSDGSLLYYRSVDKNDVSSGVAKVRRALYQKVGLSMEGLRYRGDSVLFLKDVKDIPLLNAVDIASGKDELEVLAQAEDFLDAKILPSLVSLRKKNNQEAQKLAEATRRFREHYEERTNSVFSSILDQL